MKPTRRSSKSGPAHKAHKGFTLAGHASRGLKAQRVARNTFGFYRFVRRLPVYIGLGVLVAFALKKLRGSGDGGPETWTAPPAAPTPAPIQTSGGGSAPSTPSSATPAPAADAEPSTPASAAPTSPTPDASEVETAATGTPPVGDEAGGPSIPEIEPDPEVASAAAATDAGTTSGGSDAAEGRNGADAATTIGDDLAAAADEAPAKTEE